MAIRAVRINNSENIECPICKDNLPIGETAVNPVVRHLEAQPGLISFLLSLINTRYVCPSHENCLETWRTKFHRLNAETFSCPTCRTRLANLPPLHELPSVQTRISLKIPILIIPATGSALLGISLLKGPLAAYAAQILVILGSAYQKNETPALAAAATMTALGDPVCMIALPLLAGSLPAIAHFIKPEAERSSLAASAAAIGALVGANAIMTQTTLFALGSSLLSLAAMAGTVSLLRKANV